MLIRLPGEISYLIGFLLISLGLLVDWYECLMNSHELLARGGVYLQTQLGFNPFKPPFIPPYQGGHMLENFHYILLHEWGQNKGITYYRKRGIAPLGKGRRPALAGQRGLLAILSTPVKHFLRNFTAVEQTGSTRQVGRSGKISNNPILGFL